MDKVAKNIVKVVSRSTSTKNITFETKNLARFSDGSCTCSLGDSSVLVTVVAQQSPRSHSSGIGYAPLTVDYRQKAAAFGRIPTTHLRRELGVSEKEVLTARMIDRSIRPSFLNGFSTDTQIICNLLSVDSYNDPDVLAINGASAALSVSDIPWTGPIGAVRVGLVGELPVVNPTRKELENSRLSLVLAANKQGNVVMLDGLCMEPVLMQDLSKAMKHGIKECKAIIESIVKLQTSCGKPKREFDTSLLPSAELIDAMYNICRDKITAIFTDYTLDKVGRDKELNLVREEAYKSMEEKNPDVQRPTLDWAYNLGVKRIYRQLLSEKKIRCDGRQFDEIRPINCEVDLYKPLHGSALFQRGQTQVFCSATFDSPDAAFRTDLISSIVSGVKEKNFMLHYEFPPFATNEVGRVGTLPGRRELGHGALAEKAIRPLVPEQQDMAIRLNCEVLESNGSSSMASVCAGSLSLMDAGVNVKEHVAGVAMGLISSETSSEQTTSSKDSNHIILTDILGFEDYIGDMDFKIAGTRKAITALQLDVKPTTGISMSVVQQALQKAHTARSLIISKMDAAIKSPRKKKKDNHPVMKTIHIPIHQIPQFMGFGGSNLKKLMANIGVRISSYAGTDSNGAEKMNLQQDNFVIFAPNKDAMKEADEYIAKIMEQRREPEYEFNGIYTATIVELRDNGVLVTLHPNMKPTLLPNSQLDIRVVKHPSVLDLQVGQNIQVKYFGRDPATAFRRDMDAKNPNLFQPQKLSYFKDALLVQKLDFPIYHVECLDERHFIVAGGGGSSKTGVINQFNIIELVPDCDSCRADLVIKYSVPDDVPNEAIMNGVVMRDLPLHSTRFVALGGQATVYHIEFNSATKAFEINDFELLPLSRKETELKSVSYSSGRLYTGSLDGVINIWNTDSSNAKLIKDFKMHNKEVDEIDIDTINNQIMTLSRGEAKIVLWSATNYEVLKEFKKDFINDTTNKSQTNYLYRSCRFFYDRLNSSSERGPILIIATNAIPAKSSSMLHRVSVSDNTKLSKSVSNDGIMAMTVSLDGKNIGIGTRSGDVMVLDAKLNEIYRFSRAHQNNVTDLEFLPPKSESLVLVNSETCPLISVSLDRRVVLHRPRRPSFIPNWLMLLVIVIMIYIFALSDISFIRNSSSSIGDV